MQQQTQKQYIAPLHFMGLYPKQQDGFRKKILSFNKLSSEFIVRTVCEALEVKVEDVRSDSRKREHVSARHIIIHELWYHAKAMTKVRIGKILDRHHSTVIYALHNYDDLSSTDKAFKNHIKAYKDYLSLHY